MLKHEVRLIDPETDTVVEALAQTVAAANKRCRSRLLEIDTAKAKKFAKAVAGAPEGYEMFRGGRGGVPATQVLAAWWTDAIGRKHVVTRGRRVEHDEAKRLLQKAELDERPPLFHAYPEYVCRRTMGGAEQVVCACGCGAVGTPDSLSWMGPMCGPCFDRKEELGPDGLRANVPGVLYGDRDPLGALGALACSPDGTRVATREGDNRVSYWDIPGRARTTVQFSGVRVGDVAFTLDGRRLLAVGMGNPDTRLGLLAEFDVTSDPIRRIDDEGAPAQPGLGIVPLPDGERVLIHRWLGRGVAEVRGLSSGETVRTFDLPNNMGGRLALSPDGTRFAYGGSEPMIVSVAGAGAPVPLPGWTFALAFAPDGARVFAQSRVRLVAYAATTGKEVSRSAQWIDNTVGHLAALVADPGGEFVYAGAHDGRLYVFAADTLRLRAAFDWHLGPVSGLCVSADGSKLFSAGGDGCVKVWPIRDLLRDG